MNSSSKKHNNSMNNKNSSRPGRVKEKEPGGSFFRHRSKLFKIFWACEGGVLELPGRIFMIIVLLNLKGPTSTNSFVNPCRMCSSLLFIQLWDVCVIFDYVEVGRKKYLFCGWKRSRASIQRAQH